MVSSSNGQKTQTLRPSGGGGGEGRGSAVGADASGQPSPEAPVGRRYGARAEMASLDAQLHRCEQHGDEHEGELCWQLARALSHRGRALERAVQLARRAVMLVEGGSVREELAQWLAQLGRFALAGGTLRAVLESRSDRVLALGMRSGLWLARAGRVCEAAEVLTAVAHAVPADPTPLELLGALGLASPHELDTELASRAFVQAAERREIRGERSAAFEDLLRAFEVAPGNAQAAAGLIDALVWRGRLGAADEIALRQGRAAGESSAVHVGRVYSALTRGDSPSAFGAALDAGLDSQLDWDGLSRALSGQPRFGEAMSFDEVLAHLGLDAWVEARLEVFCALDDEPSAAWQLAQRIADSDPVRARWLLAKAMAHPSSDLGFLRRSLAWAEDDPGLLVDVLCLLEREREEPFAQERAGHVVEHLLRLAQAGLVEPEVLVWAIGFIEVVPELWHSSLERAADAIAARPQWAVQALDEAESNDSLETSLRLTPLAPEREASLAGALLVRLERDPQDTRVLACFERLLGRRGKRAEAASRLGELAPIAEPGCYQLRQSRLRCLARGEPERALALLALASGAAEVPMPAKLVDAVWAAILAPQGDVRQQCLASVVQGLPVSLRATALAWLAESAARSNPDRARAHARAAFNLDPSCARAAGVVCDMAAGMVGADDVRLLERAVQVVVARASVCERIAEVYGDLGQPMLALVWAQRRLALTGGDPGAIRQLARCAAVTRDVPRIIEALVQILAQPLQVEDLAGPATQVLRALLQLHPEKATQLGWQVLQALGPAHQQVREALLEVSQVADSAGLGIAVLERWLPGAGDLAPEQLLFLARKRRLAGDVEGAAWVLWDALAIGASAETVLCELNEHPEPRSSDGLLFQTKVRARCWELLAEPEAAAESWRQFGAQLWDLAGDRKEAVAVWTHAARLSPERGLDRLASDLISFAGHAEALTHLEAMAAEESREEEQARVLTVVATVACQCGWASRGFEAGARAVALDPSRSDALTIAERCATTHEQYRELDRIYHHLADVALGRYGERAIGYRAARFFEERDEPELGFPHAGRALRAVPAFGGALELVERLASQAQSPDAALPVLAEVAAQSSPADRGRWFLRAANLPGIAPHAAIGLLLDGLESGADEALLAALESALVQTPECGGPVCQERVRAMSEAMLAQAEGPGGARRALRVARLALRCFSDPRLAWEACDAALGADGSVDEFVFLIGDLSRLLSQPDLALAFVKRVAASAGVNLGRGAAELAIATAEALGERRLRAQVLARLAVLDVADASIHRTALEAALEVSDSNLVQSVQVAMGGASDPTVLWTTIELAQAAGAEAELGRCLEQGARHHDRELRSRCRGRIRERLLAAGRRARLLQLFETWLGDAELELAGRTELVAETADLYVAQGGAGSALALLRRELEAGTVEPAVGEQALSIARAVQDEDAEQWALERLVDSSEGARRRVLVRELAELFQKHGAYERSVQLWHRLLAEDPQDPDALAALLGEAERRGDWEQAVQFIAERTALAVGEEKRRLVLRHAQVLDEHMARGGEARVLLQQFLLDEGTHLDVLTALAQLAERAGDPGVAAECWENASRLAGPGEEAATFCARSARNYLECKRPRQAATVLEQGSVRYLPDEVRHELRAAIARSMGDGSALAEALEPLAEASTGTPEERAALLLEAGYALLDSGRPDEALRLGQRAAALAPFDAEPQLFARWLEYLRRGPGSMDQAATTVSQLRGILGRRTPEQVELRAFLLGEALDVVAGRGAGLRELSHAHAECGPRPLIALGLAERLAEGPDPRRALALFDSALAGELRGVRSAAEVALRAAETCLAVEDIARGRGYVERASMAPECRLAAQRLAARFCEEERRAESSVSGADAAGHAARPDSPGVSVSAVESPSADSSKTLLSDVERADTSAQHVARTLEHADDEGLVRGIVPPKSPEASGVGPDRPPIVDADDGADELEPPSSQQLARARLGSLVVSSTTEEARLLTALQTGDEAAGERLADLLEHQPSRSADRLHVCRMLAMARPTDVVNLRRLHGAAVEDRNPVFAAAVEHVIAVLSATGEPPAPPPIAEQHELPDIVQSLVLRDAAPVAEVLSMVVETCDQAYRQDLSAYGVTGVEKLGPMAAGLGAILASVTRWLGQSRTVAFQRRAPGPFSIRVALVSPPALVIAGDPPDDPAELEWAVSYYVAATMPSNALAMGMNVPDLERLCSALQLAFGPHGAMVAGVDGVAPLAEMLWQLLPARSQRRLRELCQDPSASSIDVALRSARRACRRAGLLRSGNLLDALTRCAREESFPLLSERPAPAALARYCERSGAALDLLRLASSPEYAEVRWQKRSMTNPFGLLGTLRSE